MENKEQIPIIRCDVAIVGGGPSGLAAATELKKQGINNVIVIEREANAGGIPRHCGHFAFGMREFYNVLTGPSYAKKLVRQALKVNVDIRANSTVIKIEGTHLHVSSPEGMTEFIAERVIIATGVREKPRSARFVSGDRPLAVTSVGALQSMIYLKDNTPFKKPIIIGSELVSFSAIWTCLVAGIKPVAMLEQTQRILARRPLNWMPRIFRIPLHYNTELVRIIGKERVTGVEVKDRSGVIREISCDGVVFSGQFLPESSLARASGFDVDTHSGGPVIDQFGRCSNPNVFATGNLLRPVETAGWCWREGTNLGNWVARDLKIGLPQVRKSTPILIKTPLIKLVIPQFIQLPCTGSDGMKQMQIRFNQPCKGILIIRCDNVVIWQRNISSRAERRVLIPLKVLKNVIEKSEITLDFKSI
ncbi:MAG: pyridine nucleotide-disulfide oxidoreductase [Kangiella sp.]|nr:MAG: pyridine nucleotide-disulfide oxidoreductase [Kangiella sp.]